MGHFSVCFLVAYVGHLVRAFQTPRSVAVFLQLDQLCAARVGAKNKANSRVSRALTGSGNPGPPRPPRLPKLPGPPRAIAIFANPQTKIKGFLGSVYWAEYQGFARGSSIKNIIFEEVSVELGAPFWCEGRTPVGPAAGRACGR